MAEAATTRWFYVKDGKRHGPVAPEELADLILTSTLPQNTPVWRPGQSRWMTADSVPEFATLLPPPLATPHAPSQPPSLTVVPPTEAVCAECEARVSPEDEREVYGSVRCPSCYYGLANRRQLAFAIDTVLYCLAVMTLATIMTYTGPRLTRPAVTLRVTTLSVLLWTLPAFLFKDGFGGYSPGKLLMGLQTLDGDTRNGAGFLASFKRTLPLLIPPLPLVAGLQLVQGRRIGDGWANTRVVNRRFNWRFQVANRAISERVARQLYIKRLLLAGLLGIGFPVYFLLCLSPLRDLLGPLALL